MSHVSIDQKFRRIKLLILDVDGVLTDGKIWLTPDGNEMKSFHAHDGMGIKNLQKTGIPVAVISSRNSSIVTKRMHELGVTHIYQGQTTKLSAFEELVSLLNIPKDAIAYVGDDLVDLPVMEQVGLSIAVANAVTSVKEQADWQTQTMGGHGAVREVCDRLIQLSSKNPTFDDLL